MTGYLVENNIMQNLRRMHTVIKRTKIAEVLLNLLQVFIRYVIDYECMAYDPASVV